jgi:hypothetical protein
MTEQDVSPADEYDPEYEPDLEAWAEEDFVTRVEFVDEWVEQRYGFVAGRHREVLQEAAIKALAPRAGVFDGDEEGGIWLTDEATAVVDRACVRACRKCETARTRLPQRLVPMRRAGCRPRERRDGSRRSTRSASRGDPSDSGDPGGAGEDDPDVAREVVAGWSL